MYKGMLLWTINNNSVVCGSKARCSGDRNFVICFQKKLEKKFPEQKQKSLNSSSFISVIRRSCVLTWNQALMNWT